MKLFGLYDLTNLAGWNAPNHFAKELLEGSGTVGDYVRDGTEIPGMMPKPLGKKMSERIREATGRSRK